MAHALFGKRSLVLWIELGAFEGKPAFVEPAQLVFEGSLNGLAAIRKETPSDKAIEPMHDFLIH
jgi:hypothetical protein